ncbi:response regulator [Polluticaenibacter yanchengensis]|uniref:Response regulator transcription factor n=1 Tax=Polluticaenibacter yanchengensis TaxID=3014562 RepID=A0ABT4UL81_9BACT|nr:response regulator transcription factor [Chitinophagaceae bacterium LY-5]
MSNVVNKDIMVSIVDDHQLIINGLQKVFENSSSISLLKAYTNGNELLKDLKSQKPDVVLLDIMMPEINGIDLCMAISKQYPNIKMIALSNVDVLIQVRKMLQIGCQGYLLKNSSPQKIVTAIETVHADDRYVDDQLQKMLVDDMFKVKRLSATIELTLREKEVVALILNEHTNQEIADILCLSNRTVENIRIALLQKLKVKNTAGLVRTVLELGLMNNAISN